MNFELIKTQLTEWMTTFVEQPNPALGNWAPCPYAQAARINNKISVIESSAAELTSTVNNCLSTLDKYEVIVVCFDHTQITGADCQQLVATLNEKLMQDNYVILEDHPDLTEHVAGINMNFGHCGLLVIQHLNKLNEAADKLRAAGYYTTWNQSELDEVVTWRYHS